MCLDNAFFYANFKFNSSIDDIRQNCQVNVISVLSGSCQIAIKSYMTIDHSIITSIRAKLRTELKSNIGKRDQFRTIIFYISFALTFSSMLMFVSGTKGKYYYKNFEQKEVQSLAFISHRTLVFISEYMPFLEKVSSTLMCCL